MALISLRRRSLFSRIDALTMIAVRVPSSTLDGHRAIPDVLRIRRPAFTTGLRRPKPPLRRIR